MLSRVAEKMYWFGRYVERAENTSRLIIVNANLMLDLPRVVKHIWADMINISGGSARFYERYTRADERNVIKFMLVDDTNPGSLLCSVRAARENARTTREIIPKEAWEKFNEFHLYVKRNINRSLKRDGRHKFLNDVVTYCYQMTGLLHSCMSHGEAYDFIQIGRNLERADMTTRIVDVGCTNLVQVQEHIPDTFDNILWMNVLYSLSSYQMYRQYVRGRVKGRDVVEFLMKDSHLPRAIAHCLLEVADCIRQLPRNDLPLRGITHTQRIINDMNVSKLMEAGLHEFIDELQIDLAEIHNLVSQTWFEYTTMVNETVADRSMT